MNQKKYAYKQQKWLGPACVVIFGAGAWMAWQKIQEQPRGLIINRIIELSPSSAHIFYWVLFAASVLFVALGFALFFLSLSKEKYITIATNSIIVPRIWFGNIEVEVPFKNIKSLQIQKIQGQNFLHITHINGKLSIAQSLLSSKGAFEEICKFIAAKIQR